MSRSTIIQLRRPGGPSYESGKGKGEFYDWALSKMTQEVWLHERRHSTTVSYPVTATWLFPPVSLDFFSYSRQNKETWGKMKLGRKSWWKTKNWAPGHGPCPHYCTEGRTLFVCLFRVYSTWHQTFDTALYWTLSNTHVKFGLGLEKNK